MKPKVNNTVVILAALALMPVNFILYGLALSKLWQWFVMPLFDAPSLTILTAIGLGMVIGFVAPSESENEYESTTEAIGSMLARIIGRPFLTLFFGWIVYQLI